MTKLYLSDFKNWFSNLLVARMFKSLLVYSLRSLFKSESNFRTAIGIKAYLLLAIALFISGCSCDCTTVDTTMPTEYLNTESQVVIFADGCAQSDGSVDDEVPAVPNGSCTGTNGYQNRGRWVESPNTGVSPGSQLSIAVTGSIFYCSTGIDNLNPTPNFVIYPAQPRKDTMEDGSQLPVVAGQTIVVIVTNMSPDPGVTITSNNNCTQRTCTTTSSTPNSDGTDASDSVCTSISQCDGNGQNCVSSAPEQCTITNANAQCVTSAECPASSEQSVYTTTQTCTTTQITSNSNTAFTGQHDKHICTTVSQCDGNGQNCSAPSEDICTETTCNGCSNGTTSSCSYTKTNTITEIVPNPAEAYYTREVCAVTVDCGSNPSSCSSTGSEQCNSANYACPTSCTATSTTECTSVACATTQRTCTTTSSTPNSDGTDASDSVCTSISQCDANGQNCVSSAPEQCTITNANAQCVTSAECPASSEQSVYTTTQTCTTTQITSNSNTAFTGQHDKHICTTVSQCDGNGQNCSAPSEDICTETTCNGCSNGTTSSCSYTKTNTITEIVPNPAEAYYTREVCAVTVDCGSNPSSCSSTGSEQCNSTNYACPTSCTATSTTECTSVANVVNAPTNVCTTYNSLVAGTCAGTLGFGLTTYIGETEFSTLDNTDATNSYLPLAQFRNSYLFADIAPNELSNIYSNTTYPITEGYGYGQYVFVVPDNLQGTLGFAIARGTGTIGTGNYTLQVMSTPPACYVNQSFAGSQPGQRGALEVLVSQTNPNDVDTIVADFNALDNGNEISIYYPQLLQYIASVEGVNITSNASILADLVVTDSPSLSPMIMTTSSYSGFATSTGNIWYKVLDDYYNDNVGNYVVTTNVSTVVNTQAAQFLNDLITPITSALMDASAVIYQSFTYSHFLNIARLALLLHVMVFGAEFMLGLTSISVKDVLVRAIKIAIVIELFSTESWGFFNNYFFNLFTTGRDFLIATVTGDPTTDKIGVFGFVDDIFNTFFAKATWVKIVALMPDGVGVAFLMVIVFIMLYYLMTLARVIVAYLMINVGIALLISIAPMFFVMMLFEKTRKFFDGWLKHLADYALQPVLMFASLYIMNIVFLEMWTTAMDFDVCFGGNIFDIYVPLSTWSEGLLPNVSLGCIQTYRTVDAIDYFSMVIQLFGLVVMTFVIGAMVGHIPTITSSITGAQSAASIASAAQSTVNRGMDFARNQATNAGHALKAGANAVSNKVREKLRPQDSNAQQGGDKNAQNAMPPAGPQADQAKAQLSAQQRQQASKAIDQNEKAAKKEVNKAIDSGVKQIKNPALRAAAAMAAPIAKAVASKVISKTADKARNNVNEMPSSSNKGLSERDARKAQKGIDMAAKSSKKQVNKGIDNGIKQIKNPALKALAKLAAPVAKKLAARKIDKEAKKAKQAVAAQQKDGPKNNQQGKNKTMLGKVAKAVGKALGISKAPHKDQNNSRSSIRGGNASERPSKNSIKKAGKKLLNLAMKKSKVNKAADQGNSRSSIRGSSSPAKRPSTMSRVMKAGKKLLNKVMPKQKSQSNVNKAADQGNSRSSIRGSSSPSKRPSTMSRAMKAGKQLLQMAKPKSQSNANKAADKGNSRSSIRGSSPAKRPSAMSRVMKAGKQLLQMAKPKSQSNATKAADQGNSRSSIRGSSSPSKRPSAMSRVMKAGKRVFNGAGKTSKANKASTAAKKGAKKS